MASNKNTLQILLILLFLLTGLAAPGQNAAKENSVHKSIQERTDKIFDSLVAVRRDFHRYPELSEQEKRTSKKIEEYLLSVGLEVKTNIGGYGVVGILHGDKKGKSIAWRADIDALASDAPDVVDFKSENEGIRHICGHDVHTTIGLGIANVLAGQKEDLKGTVYFVFQPSEENYQGAKAMIDDGLFDIISPDEMYGLHLTPMPAGQIATKSGALFADYKRIKVSFQSSDDNNSLVQYTKEQIAGFQNVEPDSKFWEPKNLLDPAIGLGNPNTIFTDYITVNQDFKIEETDKEISISTYVSAGNPNQLDSLLRLLKQKIKKSKYSEKLLGVEFSFERAVVLNDKDLANDAMRIISDIYGSRNVITLYGEIPDGRGDDFAYFQQQIPGVYFLLGGSDYQRGVISMPHSPNFSVDEDCIKTGVKFFSSMITERLQE